MTDAVRAQCYAMRFPPKGGVKMGYSDIANVVKKKDGTHPTESSVREAVKAFTTKGKNKAGRPKGSFKTSKEEDKQIMTAFHKVRPPGAGVTARKVHKALPKKLKKKIGKRTIIRRLAKKGYCPQDKVNKAMQSEPNRKKRLAFCNSHKDKTVQEWKGAVQAVSDFKDFTFYPKDLKPRHKQLRAPWTYMKDSEKMKPEFLRPKRWFAKKDYARTKKQKVWGMTTSTGKLQAVKVEMPMDAEKFAELVRTKIGPFLKRSFPRRHAYQVLMDGEKFMHAPVAKRALAEWNITAFPRWPAYSADLNPQENVWPWAEEAMREEEKANDTFEVFGDRVVDAIKKYPSPLKLFGGMPKRMQMCIDQKGGAIKM